MGVNYSVVMGNADVAMPYGRVRVLPTPFSIGRDGKVVGDVPALIGRDDVEELGKRRWRRRRQRPRRESGEGVNPFRDLRLY